MKFLVAYASAHGSTREIAEHIGARLGGDGREVRVLAADDVTTTDGYDAVVIASAVHGGAWLPSAAAFVRTHATTLARQQVWAVSVASVGEIGSFFGRRMTKFMRARLREPRQVQVLRGIGSLRGAVSVAGAVDRGDWGVIGNLFLRACGGTFGDHRDWPGIDAWTDGVLAAVTAQTSEATSS